MSVASREPGSATSNATHEPSLGDLTLVGGGPSIEDAVSAIQAEAPGGWHTVRMLDEMTGISQDSGAEHKDPLTGRSTFTSNHQDDMSAVPWSTAGLSMDQFGVMYQ